jgi:formylglycine-generating enzyme required for sulfatase activity
VLARDYADSPWHAVDFRTLAIAKYDIEQWWLHFCRGEAYRTDSVALGEALR